MKRKAVVLAVLILGVGAATALAANVSGDGTLVGSTGPDIITAGNGDDIVWGLGTPNGTTDNISVGNGNDQIDAGGHCTGVAPGDYPHRLPNSGSCGHGPTPPDCGTATISIPGRSSGNDTVYGNCGPNNISNAGRGQGNDYFWVPGGPNNITVSNGDDTIDLSKETSGPNNIVTGTGNDTVYAQNGQVDHITCGSRATIVYVDSHDTTKNCTVRTSRQSASDMRGATRLRTHSKKHTRASHKGRRAHKGGR